MTGDYPEPECQYHREKMYRKVDGTYGCVQCEVGNWLFEQEGKFCYNCMIVWLR